MDETEVLTPDIVITIRVRGDYSGDADRLARRMSNLVRHPNSYNWTWDEEVSLEAEVQRIRITEGPASGVVFQRVRPKD